MFGDDSDTTVTTVRVGSGTTLGRARGADALCKEGGFGAWGVGSGLCKKLWAERREEREARQQFSETENVRR